MKISKQTEVVSTILEPGQTQDEVCAWLESRLRQVVSRRASLAACLWGDAGIGKSFRLDAILKSLPCTALRFTAGNAMLGLVQAVLAATSGPHSVGSIPVWAISRLHEARQGRLNDGKQIAEALGAHLEMLRPVVLAIEDVHRASPDVLAFLNALRLNTSKSSGIGLLMTSRSAPDDSFREVQALGLNPLGPDRVRELLESSAGAVLPDLAHTWIWERSRGNPLFTLEYFHFLTRQGFLWNDARRWRWREPKDVALPTNLEGLLVRLLETAIETNDDRHLLETLSVLPDAVSQTVILRTSRLEPQTFAKSLDRLEGLALLRQGRFAHPLYRDAMFSRISGSRRRELARLGLEALDAESAPSAVLACELLELAEVESTVMLERLSRAALEARNSADVVAASLFQARAVEHARGEPRFGLAFEAAQQMLPINLDEATRLAGIAHLERPDHAEAAWLYAECLVRTGESERAERQLERVQGSQNQMWWGRLLRLRVQQHDFAAAVQMWSAQPVWQASAAVLVRRDAAWALALVGELDQSEQVLQSMLDPWPEDSLEGALIRVALGFLRTLQGRCTEANGLISAVIGTLEGLNVPRDLARALELLAEVLEQLGDFRAAAVAAERAVRVRGELGDALGVARAQSRLASVVLELGEYERSEELLLEGYGLLERLNADTALALWEAQLANLYSEWLSPHRASLALSHAQSALERARTNGSPVLLGDALSCAGLIEARHGDPNLALTHSLEALAMAEELGRAQEAALENLAHAAALEALGRNGEAIQGYERAVTQLRHAGLASSERYALELDRLRQDEPAARIRLEGFKTIHHIHAANLARRYFPSLEQNAPIAGIEIQVLGPLRVVRDAQTLKLNTRTGRVMLGMLVAARLAGRGGCSSLELCDALWPDGDDRSSQTNLKHLVYRLRSSLGSGSVLRLPDGYALGAAETDAERFLASGDLGLWRGNCLEEVEVDEAAGEARSQLIQHLMTQIQIGLDHEPRNVVKAARLLVGNEPYDPSALRLLCQALHLSQNRRDLARVYTEAKTRMLEVNETLPERWQDFLTG
jgi:tetratricopeptide (TPR) repeat protein